MSVICFICSACDGVMRRPPLLSCVILFILSLNKSVVICRISSVVGFVWMLSMIICVMKVDMM